MLSCGMSLGLSQDLRLAQLQLCSCCGQDMNMDPLKEGLLTEFLNGCAGQDMRYRLCPTCLQSVPKSMWSRGYKSKWTRRVKKLISTNPTIQLPPGFHVFRYPVRAYDSTIPNNATIMTVDSFLEGCRSSSLTNYDGWGYACKDGKMDHSVKIIPSTKRIPKDATHIAWFNR